MKEWQFNTLFVLAVGGAVVMLFGDKLGIEVRPEVVTVFGTVMAFVLTQRRQSKIDKREDDRRDKKEDREEARP